MFEFYVDDPLHAAVRPPEAAVCQDEPSVVRVDVFNPAAARDVEVELTGDGIRVEPPKQTVPLAARAKRSLEFRVVAARGGKATLKASARSGSDHNQAQAEVEVFATKASPALLRQARAGTLLLDVFGSDHGRYKDKPVLLNGVPIGALPQQADQWANVEMPLTPQAIAALGENNEVRIENRVGDAFKVRNLRLRLDGPVRVLSETNRGAFTSCSWEYAEGKVFKLGEPLSGIVVRIPPETSATK
jgi:hypothetical protein